MSDGRVSGVIIVGLDDQTDLRLGRLLSYHVDDREALILNFGRIFDINNRRHKRTNLILCKHFKISTEWL